jgi:chromosome partitioning protein
MAKRLAVFNHKGGVSKTTSTYNIGWMMSKTSRVLLADADPQCNLTGLFLRNDFEKYYLEQPTKNQNLRDGVAPAFSGKPTPIVAVDCIAPPRAPNLRLLAGHANLSEWEASLTFAQTASAALATLQNLPGAFAELLRLTEEKYNIDYTIIDMNPGLSAINQNLFLISDGFIIPTNPDPFSIMALDTLEKLLPRWVAWKNDAVLLFADAAYPLPAGTPKFCGTLIQRFNIRNGKAAKPYRDNIDEINDSVVTDVVPALAKAGMLLATADYGGLVTRRYCLSQIQDFHGLLPKSQDAGVPVFELTDAEINEQGSVLAGAKKNRDGFRAQFQGISDELSALLTHA